MLNDVVDSGVGKANADTFFQGWVGESMLIGMERKDDWKEEESTTEDEDDQGADDKEGEGVVKTGVRQ